jgi:hypothetical protein
VRQELRVGGWNPQQPEGELNVVIGARWVFVTELTNKSTEEAIDEGGSALLQVVGCDQVLGGQRVNVTGDCVCMERQLFDDWSKEVGGHAPVVRMRLSGT